MQLVKVGDLYLDMDAVKVRTHAALVDAGLLADSTEVAPDTFVAQFDAFSASLARTIDHEEAPT